jgi:hypothetical protein
MKKIIWVAIIVLVWVILVIGNFTGPFRIELTESEDSLFPINKWIYKYFPDTELIKTNSNASKIPSSNPIGLIVLTKNKMFFQKLKEGKILEPIHIKLPDFFSF